ncbi:helix-turn-helix transcriptional regulator [Haloarchaeobius litoreus]|uniref:helix-turn-helix transcriptional regulator n=1 Tax=Haloarchaeobius litoreus TaxID=755306 RepID=UPI003F61D2A5
MQFAFASCRRLELLERLADEPAAPSELVSKLPISRRTVHRHVTDLVDREWVVKQDGRYRLTVSGELLLTVCDSTKDAFEAVKECRPVLDRLPQEHAPDPAWLTDVDSFLATRKCPYRPIQRVETIIDETTSSIRTLSPSIGWLLVDRRDDLGQISVVTCAHCYDSESKEVSNPLSELDTADGVTLHLIDEDLIFGLLLTDRVTLVLGYDDTLRLTGCIESRSDELRSWASTVFDRHLSCATTSEQVCD